MNTMSGMNENATKEELKTVSAWQTARFRRLFAIAVGTAVLLSVVALLKLNADVDNLNKSKVPYIEHQLDKLQAH